MSGLEHLNRIQREEAAEHDKAVAILSPSTVMAAARDLCPRLASNRKDPEQRWVMARKAALLRRIDRENLNRRDP